MKTPKNRLDKTDNVLFKLKTTAYEGQTLAFGKKNK